MATDPELRTSGFTADPLAARLGPHHPGPPCGYVTFKGHLSPLHPAGAPTTVTEGEHEGDQRHACPPASVYRLYDDTFWSYLEIRAADIVAQVTIPVNSFDSRGMIWVKRDAQITKCQVAEAHCVAEETDKFMGGDPAGGPTRPKGWPY